MRLALWTLLLFPHQETTKAEGPATVAPVSGDVRAWRGAQKKLESVDKRLQLEAGDRVGSVKGEPVSIMADDDVILSLKGVKVGDKSGLVLVRTDAGLVVRLQDGSIIVDAFERPLTVETAGGRIVGKQAYFLVEVKDGVTKATAIDGDLTFSNPAGEVTVTAGHEASAKTGAAPGVPKPSTVSEPAVSANLAKNPGFEDEITTGWRKIEKGDRLRAIDEKVFHSGKRALRGTATPDTVERGTPPTTTWLRFDQKLTFVPGKRYLVRVYARLQIRRGTMKVALGVDGVKPNNPDLAEMHWTGADVGDAWKMLRAIVTATKEKGEIDLRLVISDADFDATLWADDWCVIELPPAPASPK